MKITSEKSYKTRSLSAHRIGKRFTRTVLSVALLSLPVFSYAQTPEPVNDAFLVNTFTPEEQLSPAMAHFDNGQFVVVWTSKKQDGNGSGVFAQRYDEFGVKVGTAFQVNTEVRGDQETPSIATLGDGSFVIAWQTRTLSGSGDSSLSMQRFDASGTRAGDEIAVYTSTDNYLSSLSVSSLSSGGFALGWSERNKSFTQTYNANGEATGTTIQTDTVKELTVEGTLDGGFITAGFNFDGIMVQKYTANGAATGAEHLVSSDDGTPTDLDLIHVDTARLANGDLIVTWEAMDSNTFETDVYARHLNADGVPTGKVFRVNSHTPDIQVTPSVTALKDGGYVIAWDSADHTGDQGGIYAQAYYSDSSLNGSEFLVSSVSNNSQMQPAISLAGDDKFVVSWSSKDAQGDRNIYAQRFQLTADPVNSMTLSLPQAPILEGDVLDIPVQVTGANVYGIDAMIGLNNTATMRIIEGTYGDFLPTDERLSVPMGLTDNLWDGALALMAPAAAKSGEGLFATIKVKAEQAGTVDLMLQTQMTNQQGQNILRNSAIYSLMVHESVNLTGNVSALGFSGDYSQITLRINGELVSINPDGRFEIRTGLGQNKLTLSAPGHLSAEKYITLSADQADIDFGEVNLVGGDSNGDNRIDIADLTQLLGAYRSQQGAQNGYVAAADFNRDGEVNLQDLTLLGASFGKQGPQSW
ncbi:dockerin type I domain-containing protein [Pseudoalteromonas rubra]|uniref:dockerin type I domain-containing protein n=1 Tax=Pseudoalteromonas rubra TaxID=43658 RepID=UPI000F79D77D|nr:dockerin type I domain-containing protein [Pseudoalteromonas rubra]